MVWITGTVIGLAVAIVASRHALDSATEVGKGLGLSPLVLGMTVIAVGTDLPEIANSLVSSASGHGDVNVGDSIGSVVTQSTLVLGILCLTGRLQGSRRFVITTGTLTVLALLIGARLVGDQLLDRSDAALLLATWVAGTFIIQRPTPAERRANTEAGLGSGGRRADPSVELRRALGRTAVFLGVVGLGATVAIECFTRAATEFGVPEYQLSFFVLAAGTSLPELVVDLRALQRGEGELAFGDLLGSSFVDATLSPAVGPLLFPTALSAGLARGSLLTAVVIAAVTAILARDRVHRWPTGVVLILLYLALYPALIG
jgi:cation:H+ antiporter